MMIRAEGMRIALMLTSGKFYVLRGLSCRRGRGIIDFFPSSAAYTPAFTWNPGAAKACHQIPRLTTRGVGGRLLALAVVAIVVVAATGCTLAPKAIDDNEFQRVAADRVSRVDEGQEPIHGTIDVYEAMARALKYNLDAWIEIQQTALRKSELEFSHYAMLPQAVANAGYAMRNQYPASRSIGIDKESGEPTGKEALTFNSSQDKRNTTADLSFSWSILDFGLSFVRARQAGDRALAADETRRKVMIRIIEDVRTAYWRAVGAERLSARLRMLEVRTQAALAAARATAAQRTVPMITALQYERELLEMRRLLQELKRDMSVAKLQLAALMNLKPGATFKIDTRHIDARREAADFGVEQMIETAVVRRPELRDITYQQRIIANEAHAALLELLPGLQLFSARSADANPYLLNADWISWGAKASWNLIKLAQYPARRNVLEREGRLLDQRALAMVMAVMTQVYVARVRYALSRETLATARDQLTVQNRIIRNMRIEREGGRVSEQALLREELNTLVAEARRDIAFADHQNAFANMHASMGTELLDPVIIIERDVGSVARALRAKWFELGDQQAVKRMAATERY